MIKLLSIEQMEKFQNSLNNENIENIGMEFQKIFLFMFQEHTSQIQPTQDILSSLIEEKQKGVIWKVSEFGIQLIEMGLSGEIEKMNQQQESVEDFIKKINNIFQSQFSKKKIREMKKGEEQEKTLERENIDSLFDEI